MKAHNVKMSAQLKRKKVKAICEPSKTGLWVEFSIQDAYLEISESPLIFVSKVFFLPSVNLISLHKGTGLLSW